MVNFQEEAITGLLLDSSLDTTRISHCQIITNNLNAALAGEVSPGLPVILIKGVLNGNNEIFLDITQIKVSEFNTRDPLGRVGVRVLEVQIVLAVLIKFGGSDVKGNFNFPFIAGFFDGFRQEFKRLIGTRNIGSKTTLITNIYSYFELTLSFLDIRYLPTVNAILGTNDLLESVISLCSDLKGFREGGCTGRKKHKFLEGKLVTGMRATIDNVEGRSRKNVGRLDSRKLGKVLVEGNTLLTSTSLGYSNRYAKDSVGTKLALVRSTIKLDEEIINVLLLGHGEFALD